MVVKWQVNQTCAVCLEGEINLWRSLNTQSICALVCVRPHWAVVPCSGCFFGLGVPLAGEWSQNRAGMNRQRCKEILNIDVP